jgi:dTDP-glucose 4,6-dehydratase
MRLLVCGGAGFIGSNFIRYMLNQYSDLFLVNYDKLTYAGNLDNLRDVENNPHYVFIQGDICDLDKVNQVVKEYQITHLINFAAETHVDRSIHGGCKEFVLTNTLGVQMLLEAVRFNKIEKFINVSTDEVYGELPLDSQEKFTEQTPIWPNMPYAAAKAGGDLMCHAYFVTHKVPVIVTHCSNNYGPYQFPEKIIPFFIFRLLNNQRVPLYGDGLYVRDWIYVLDHVKALDLLLKKGQPGEVYNIGANNERTNLEVTRLILKIMGKGEEMIEFVADRPGHDRRYAIDASKLRSLGWQPEYPRERFEEGLRKTVEWYLTHKEWVEKLQKRQAELNPHLQKEKNNL